MRRLHCRHDSRICSTAANIAAHPLANLAIGQLDGTGSLQIGGRIAGVAFADFGEQRHGGTKLAGSAISALETIVFDERRLDGMQSPALGEPFDRRDLVAVVRHRKR